MGGRRKDEVEESLVDGNVGDRVECRNVANADGLGVRTIDRILQSSSQSEELLQCDPKTTHTPQEQPILSPSSKQPDRIADTE